VKTQFRLLVLSILSLVVTFSLTTAGFAQTKAGDQKTKVTGCLQKGDEADEFSITGEDGKTYQLRSSAGALSEHVGHKVTIIGTFKAEKKEGESQEYSPKESAEIGQIRVENLIMVSNSCK